MCRRCSFVPDFDGRDRRVSNRSGISPRELAPPGPQTQLRGWSSTHRPVRISRPRQRRAYVSAPTAICPFRRQKPIRRSPPGCPARLQPCFLTLSHAGALRQTARTLDNSLDWNLLRCPKMLMVDGAGLRDSAKHWLRNCQSGRQTSLQRRNFDGNLSEYADGPFLES